MTATTHPDYFHATRRDPTKPNHDPCVCGGIRHWHAVKPHGCDDCPCTEFVLLEQTAGQE